MQQPFYAAIADLFRQQHQFNAQAGKQFYAERPWMLSQLVGDKGMIAMLTSKEAQYEQFRIEIVLTPNAQEMRTLVDNQIIPMRMQLGMLGPQEAADLMGRSFPSDVDRAGREYTRRMALAQQARAEAAQQQQDADAIAQEEVDVAAQEEVLAGREHEDMLKEKQLAQKLHQPYAVNDAKNLDPANDPLMRQQPQSA